MRSTNGRGPERPPWRLGDRVRVPSGKTGHIVQLGQRVDLEGGRDPRAIVQIACAIGPTDHLSIRAAYHPADLIPAELEAGAIARAIQ